jgi:aspartyl-tRNA(Asn)/glutamyl-tRNA(Gln) amidotransferase subunit B
MFCDCLNDESEITPNTNACPICMGHPGTLPVANRKAVEHVIKTGYALHCSISEFSKFDRKNYFYPDLPKAYQISQYDKPLCKEGYMVLPESGKKIRITRIHLEEDTARLAHAADGKHSLVDFNRAGVPLMELVTEPDFHDAADVVEFAQEFQLILKHLGVSNADMEKGNLRLEANISIAPEGADKLGTKVEVKNLNSFRAVGRAIEYEISRQAAALERGERIVQETRGWNEAKQETFSQRSKEEAHDYRYFPEPDLPPMQFEPSYLESLKGSLPELPEQKRVRFSDEYNLSAKQVDILVHDMYLADFFEDAVSELRALRPAGNPEMVFNYLASDMRGLEADTGISLQESKLTPGHLASIVAHLEENKISSRAAKDVLRATFLDGRNPEDIIREEGLAQVSDEGALEAAIRGVMDANPNVVQDYKNGKQNSIQFLVGQVMARTKGTANPGVVRALLEKLLAQ